MPRFKTSGSKESKKNSKRMKERRLSPICTSPSFNFTPQEPGAHYYFMYGGEAGWHAQSVKAWLPKGTAGGISDRVVDRWNLIQLAVLLFYRTIGQTPLLSVNVAHPLVFNGLVFSTANKTARRNQSIDCSRIYFLKVYRQDGDKDATLWHCYWWSR